MFEVSLRGIKVKGKILLGNSKFQVIAEGRVGNIPRQFGKGRKLVLLLGNIQIPGSQIAIQPLQQGFRLPVRPHPDAGKRHAGSKQYERPLTPHSF